MIRDIFRRVFALIIYHNMERPQKQRDYYNASAYATFDFFKCRNNGG